MQKRSSMLEVAQPPGTDPTRRWKYRVSSSPTDPDWDAFVLNHPDPHHEQTSLWSEARQELGWRPIRIILRAHGKIIGGAQILQHSVKRWFNIGYIPRGPLLTDAVDPAQFLAELKRVARVRKLAYVAISLPYSAHSLVPEFKRAGVTPRPDHFPPSVWAKATLAIDLSQDEEKIFASMSSTKRNQVRRGLRAGLVVREGTGAEIPTFYALLQALCRRRGVPCNVPDGPFLPVLWEKYSPHGLIKLLIAEWQGQPVCAMLLTLAGTWAQAWRIGWSGEHKEIFPSDVLWWESIRWAKRNGYATFDLLGIDIRDARELTAGRSRSEPFKCSITSSKMSIGGKILLLPGEFCFFPSPIVDSLFRGIGAPLLRTRMATRILESLYKKAVSRG